MIAALWLAACGGDDLGIGATPTVTATRTPQSTATPTRTRTPVSLAQVSGLVVVGSDVGSGSEDGLAPLPPDGVPGVGKGFDRGLGGAEWVVDDGAIRGATGEDGRFSVSGLTPGRHALRFTKTVDGNLMEFVVPIQVGDDGAAEVLAEVSWGLVRATSTYTVGGDAMRAVFAPNGVYLITRDGVPVELFDGWRTLIDGDGDGRFDPQGCGTQLYRCNDDGGCNSPEEICLCVPSCPDCQDCPEQACVSRAYLHDPACGPDGLCKALPYQCGDDHGCANPGDQCACVASCFACDNCESAACVEPCQATEPIDLLRVTVYGNERLVTGQDGSARASAILSDGSGVDVTWLVAWTSSAPAVATVDSWGALSAVAAGDTGVIATLAGLASEPLALTVVERPSLRHLYVQTRCYYPPDDPRAEAAPRPLPPASDAMLPPPWCAQVLRIGATLPLQAIGEFDTGYYEDLTDEVTWSVDPAAVGSIAGGQFTALAAGAASVRAALGAVTSDALPLTVVEQASITSLAVYPSRWAYQFVDGPIRADGSVCFECGYFLTLLRGDAVQFAATAHYDTGEWEDVTARVAWRSNASGVLTVDAAGSGSAVGAGEATVDATLGAVTSAPVSLRVVNEATLTNLSIYQDGADRVVAVGGEAVFHAVGFYDVGFDRDVTAQAVWQSSDPSVGSFDTAGVFSGRKAGTVTVWAALDGQQSPSLSIEVFATSALDYCDAAAINRGEWSDDFNRVTLESDCAAYQQPDVVELRFTVTETQRPGGVFDPCLDLYAYRGDTLVRTIREEGCGEPFLPAGAPQRDDALLKYQLKAFWDLKDDAGTAVPAGTYTIRGRFYLYYDPVVSIDVRVAGPNG
ncbi:MAG: hypothetical protein SF182_18305 [Deltaproteobacteria bacterium]|nr:hypothetical protein [Deltaproteobacteria bacterium]